MKAINLSPDDLQKKAEDFLIHLVSKINTSGFRIEPHWDIDHLCFRVDSLESYELYKENFVQLGTLLTESDVNGRPISTFELNYPIRFQSWLIRLIELPAPKKGKITKTGFEHIEIVIDRSLVSLQKEYSHLNWDSSGMIKLFNSELELSFGESAVKFHNLSLKSVVNFEKRPKFAIIVTELKLFEIFKDHEPFIGGTIPLGIDLPESDIDFLVTFPTHFDFKNLCTAQFSGNPDFAMSQGHANGADYSLCQFTYRRVKIEIYSSVTTTFEQNGFQHYQIEEKLLKYGVLEWQNEVIKLKSQGLKTEPAFARLLNKDDVDSYLYLKQLQKKPIQELREIIQTATLLN